MKNQATSMIRGIVAAFLMSDAVVLLFPNVFSNFLMVLSLQYSMNISAELLLMMVKLASRLLSNVRHC